MEEDKRARWEHITRTAVAGRGAFGTVLTGTWRRPGAKPVPVAVKALQPVAPPSAHDIQAMQAYKVRSYTSLYLFAKIILKDSGCVSVSTFTQVNMYVCINKKNH